jgi:hypothetical protein
MFTTGYIETTSVYVFPLAKPTKAQQVALDWEMAHALDAKADEYKAAGNFKMAKICASRALARAIKASS